ncbi:hypothetical protein ADUPG1_006171 [Aduncisulcus paluster]|uniref:Uncharacterized protein n=1 Tax=Aduncisulcus paluster TaxID=2918883 RepID=A0ABQ5KIW2_9EUKA|nr:hypothetical protein ADUPG1_006171 [Aduncisulcus paluster]
MQTWRTASFLSSFQAKMRHQIAYITPLITSIFKDKPSSENLFIQMLSGICRSLHECRSLAWSSLSSVCDVCADIIKASSQTLVNLSSLKSFDMFSFNPNEFNSCFVWICAKNN